MYILCFLYGVSMEQLGIEPALLLAQIVNFCIIVFVLTKLLYKPILTMLEKRKKEIEEGLVLTQKMREEDEKLTVKRTKLLDQARKEAQEVITEARKQGQSAEKDLLDQAHKEAGEILEKGRAEVARVRESMEKEVRETAVTLSVAMAKRLLSSALTSTDQHKIIEKHLKELESIKIS